MRKNLIVIVCLGLLTGCSTRKDTAKNRAFHNATAWLNTLFNAEKEMDKKLDALAFEYQDNYSEILPVDPRPEIEAGILTEDDIERRAQSFNPGARGSGSQSEVTGFELVEKKALKAIDRHSMLINGKERNKTMTRAYLILGKARYNQGRSFEALEALNYVRTDLPYHKKYTPEARLYTALANLQIGNTFEGERILLNMYKDGGYKKKFQEQIDKHFAQYLIGKGQYEDAINVLDRAISNTKNKKRKARYYFIEGQLYSLLDMQNEAGETFTRVFQMKPGFEMEVKSQLGIAANFDPEINRYSSYKEHLLKVADKGNYISRKNELLYAVGDIAYKSGKNDEARKYLLESLEGPPSDPYVRGLAYERYADMEFDEGNYVHASAYYDSAISTAPYDKDIDRIIDRATSLNNLMKKYYLVKKNDSILHIVNMSEEDRAKFFNDHIAKLKLEDEKKKRQMEEEATVFMGQVRGGGNFEGTFDEGGSGFYFYNTSQKSKGQNDFRRIWGNIRLADSWRSSDAGTMTLEEQEAELLGQGDTQNPRRYELEFYLEQIPSDPTDLYTLKIERDTAELSLGIGYYDLFDNAKTASQTLEHLLSTPPKEEATEAQAMYQLYRIYDKAGDEAQATVYKDMIMDKYPMSVYAQYILTPDIDYITPTTKEALDFYEGTYALYKDSKYDSVKINTGIALDKYPTEEITAKFVLLNALAIGKTEGRDPFKNSLELITVAYQNTDEARKAQEILDLLNGVVREHDEKEPEKKDTQTRKEEEKKKREEQRKRNASRQGDTGRPTPSRGDSRSQQEQQRNKPDRGGQPAGPGRPGGDNRRLR